ncbi:hypothetical protein Afil01_25960 [Actinorhabdospora filicis]|uniref:Uncharacterized protein n=1 Tax=Actinorhabdospora filicis TaxID=1785913 RepID=A0A9W6SIN7_9ACTN|nr:hypothetical protein Afil01_25960 [Actinorhabdospora filicis]
MVLRLHLRFFVVDGVGVRGGGGKDETDRGERHGTENAEPRSAARCFAEQLGRSFFSLRTVGESTARSGSI